MGPELIKNEISRSCWNDFWSFHPRRLIFYFWVRNWQMPRFEGPKLALYSTCSNSHANSTSWRRVHTSYWHINGTTNNNISSTSPWRSVYGTCGDSWGFVFSSFFLSSLTLGLKKAISCHPSISYSRQPNQLALWNYNLSVEFRNLMIADVARNFACQHLFSLGDHYYNNYGPSSLCDCQSYVCSIWNRTKVRLSLIKVTHPIGDNFVGHDLSYTWHQISLPKIRELFLSFMI